MECGTDQDVDENLDGSNVCTNENFIKGYDGMNKRSKKKSKQQKKTIKKKTGKVASSLPKRHIFPEIGDTDEDPSVSARIPDDVSLFDMLVKCVYLCALTGHGRAALINSGIATLIADWVNLLLSHFELMLASRSESINDFIFDRHPNSSSSSSAKDWKCSELDIPVIKARWWLDWIHTAAGRSLIPLLETSSLLIKQYSVEYNSVDQKEHDSALYQDSKISVENFRWYSFASQNCLIFFKFLRVLYLARR